MRNVILEKIIGMNFEEAFDYAYEQDFILRKVNQDGQSFMVTMDFRLDRINVWLEENIIVKAYFG